LPHFHTPFTPQTGFKSAGSEGSINLGVNMAAPTLLLNKYAPIQLPQQLNPMP